MHFSSLLHVCILSSSSHTDFVRHWNCYDFYLSYQINTVIISCFIYKTWISQFSLDITASWKTLHKHTCFQNCIFEPSLVI
jgi:hypothetical protein